MIYRGQNSKSIELNIVGSSVFGRYPKISIEKTYNMFESDNFMVPYAGYQIAILSNLLGNGTEGRGIYTSTKFNRMVVVIGGNVYLINLLYTQLTDTISFEQIFLIGNLQTDTGPVYITENNKPQILISDGVSLYLYDPTLAPAFSLPSINFTPGYVSFHDTYFLAAASNDNTYNPPANNTWRLSGQNDGMTWLDDAASVGLLQTKPDNVKAVVRFPSKGNMIFVMGEVTTEAWFDTGSQLFPYQRNNQFNIDYGCISAATVAYMDEIVVWLAQNEKSGPIIMYSNGGEPKKITTDGIDQLFSELQNPQDSQGFLYRQDGHLFYHINFYSDNLSLFYDFNKDKFYHACDQNLNYFVAAEIAFFGNQYYFVSKNDGNIYAFDTAFTTYQGVEPDLPTTIITYEIPRIRTCKNIRQASQDYFIVNDVGFTIESGETNWQQQTLGPINLITQQQIQPAPGVYNLITQDGNLLVTQSGNTLTTVYQQQQPETSYLVTQNGNYLIANQQNILYSTPAVDLSISWDGGASFGPEWRYELPPIGQRRNRLMWWPRGMSNDVICQFKFWGLGRVVCTNGTVTVRT